MGSFSLMHWIVVLAIILILFGAGKLPRVMGDFAKGIKAFKAGMKDEEDEAEATATPAQVPPPAAAKASAAPAASVVDHTREPAKTV
ncbi:MAG TPA: twin-arginine translocase TatA/TatE family subunit [Stellaceae bacterium]|jgi:sec-independent protein translocase protein TatA